MACVDGTLIRRAGGLLRDSSGRILRQDESGSPCCPFECDFEPNSCVSPRDLVMTISGVTLHTECCRIAGGQSQEFAQAPNPNRSYLLEPPFPPACVWDVSPVGNARIRTYDTTNCTGGFSELVLTGDALVGTVTAQVNCVIVVELFVGGVPTPGGLLFRGLRCTATPTEDLEAGFTVENLVTGLSGPTCGFTAEWETACAELSWANVPARGYGGSASVQFV